jgi:hypothetical protein
MTTDFTHVFAIPGQNHIIDAVRADGRSMVNGQTLDEIKARGPEYAAVELMPWEDYRSAQIARQNTPITWARTSGRKYNEMLEVLPPAYWDSYGFLVGEPYDHSAETGKPRFQAYRMRGGKGPYSAIYEVASRPLTVAEFKSNR